MNLTEKNQCVVFHFRDKKLLRFRAISSWLVTYLAMEMSNNQWRFGRVCTDPKFYCVQVVSRTTYLFGNQLVFTLPPSRSIPLVIRDLLNGRRFAAMPDVSFIPVRSRPFCVNQESFTSERRKIYTVLRPGDGKIIPLKQGMVIFNNLLCCSSYQLGYICSLAALHLRCVK